MQDKVEVDLIRVESADGLTSGEDRHIDWSDIARDRHRDETARADFLVAHPRFHGVLDTYPFIGEIDADGLNIETPGYHL
jgi:hypothetical protein